MERTRMVSPVLPICPRCGLSDKTYKVSLLYLEASARLNHLEKDNQPELDSLLADISPEQGQHSASTKTIRSLLDAFAPPAGEKRITQRIHPDGMVLVFSLMALLLLYNIASSQPQGLPFAVIIMAAALLGYLLLRNPLIQRHQLQNQQEQQGNQRVEHATARWMRLFYCSRDKGVFDPGQGQLVPLEQLSDYLREQ